LACSIVSSSARKAAYFSASSIVAGFQIGIRLEYPVARLACRKQPKAAERPEKRNPRTHGLPPQTAASTVVAMPAGISLRGVDPRLRGDDVGVRRRHFIVGMTNSAPSLTPLGQREVTVLVLV